MAQGMASVDHEATYLLSGLGMSNAPRLQARAVVCYSATLRHYCIVWKDAAMQWWHMDDMQQGAVAQKIEGSEVDRWCRPQDDGWSPTLTVYARL
jgi:hypothetical protein